jgi:hypothetical protein
MATGRVPTTANSPLTAKGDLFGYSTAPARVAVGANGETLVADSSTSTGLRYGANFAAGKNKIINGAFDFWQRGTSFSNPTNGTYTADRWFVELDGSGFTRTISQQTFTPGTAPVAGYEGQYFYRWDNSVAGTGNTINALSTRLEDIRTFAGQTVTFSFWAKADASRALTVYAYQQSSGGSGTVTTTVGSATLTTSWARYTMTVAIPSLSGITIGTNSNLQIRIAMPTGTTMTCDFWGMQMEASSVATAFQTATGTLQGELAACQRYYYRFAATGTNQYFGAAYARSASFAFAIVKQPVTMRSAPSLAFASGSNYFRFQLGSGDFDVTTLDGTYYATTDTALVRMSSSGMTTGNGGMAQFNNASAFIEMSSEL